jgi:hypothetical protein
MRFGWTVLVGVLTTHAKMAVNANVKIALDYDAIKVYMDPTFGRST